MGAEILMSPSGWIQGDMKVEHWQTMVRARALENGCYVIAPDQVGNIYIGHSMVVDPFGGVVIDMGNRQGLEIVDLDLSMVGDVREKLPLLKPPRRYLWGSTRLQNRHRDLIKCYISNSCSIMKGKGHDSIEKFRGQGTGCQIHRRETHERRSLGKTPHQGRRNDFAGNSLSAGCRRATACPLS
jgi:hypothetical protein